MYWRTCFMRNISQRSCWKQGDYKILFSKKKKCLQQRKKLQNTRLYHKCWQFFSTASTVCSNRYSLTLRECNPYSMTHFEVGAILKQSWFSIKQKHELKGSYFASRNIRDLSHSERKHESNLFRQNPLQMWQLLNFDLKHICIFVRSILIFLIVIICMVKRLTDRFKVHVSFVILETWLMQTKFVI